MKRITYLTFKVRGGGSINRKVPFVWMTWWLFDNQRAGRLLRNNCWRPGKSRQMKRGNVNDFKKKTQKCNSAKSAQNFYLGVNEDRWWLGPTDNVAPLRKNILWWMTAKWNSIKMKSTWMQIENSSTSAEKCGQLQAACRQTLSVGAWLDEWQMCCGRCQLSATQERWPLTQLHHCLGRRKISGH